MINSFYLRVTRKIQAASLNNLYSNIVKLEWFAIAGLCAWLLMVFLTILN